MQKSKALIAGCGIHSVILYAEGPLRDMSTVCPFALDFGLSYPPEGLTIWEGDVGESPLDEVFTGSPAAEIMASGEFRSLTDEEWKTLKFTGGTRPW